MNDYCRSARTNNDNLLSLAQNKKSSYYRNSTGQAGPPRRVDSDIQPTAGVGSRLSPSCVHQPRAKNSVRRSQNSRIARKQSKSNNSVLIIVGKGPFLTGALAPSNKTSYHSGRNYKRRLVFHNHTQTVLTFPPRLHGSKTKEKKDTVFASELGASRKSSYRKCFDSARRTSAPPSRPTENLRETFFFAPQ